MQQYPPGTQDNSCHFSSRIPVTQNGKKLEVPTNGRGLESAIRNPKDFLEADSDEGVWNQQS